MKRKAQGAIEYLFMIAAALIIIAIVIRYLRSAGQSTGSTIIQGQSSINSKLSSELNSALS
ncbi:class III signal peptide-containing protein [Thermococcus waiotapuensis]|uniref:Class III signal peptide-containing protein n=1 Tax=Thermococcus waiotapuensis TaxID=90909 RepID=A0AAE4NWT0_9EURY|nr:class III signal peptide-containing protein [Thermococcus waiotapuensis]MDV3104771.1 class III signal peptide-containing protein [Thermococcus waiotapuensis]